MSVFKNFLLLFTTDSANAVKGVDKIDASTKKYSKTAKDASIQSDKFGGSVQNLAKRLGVLALAYVGLNSVLASVKNSIHFADNLGEFSDFLGANVEDISAWADAVKLSGGSVESFQSSIKMLTASVVDFAAKGTSRAAPFFQQLGIKMVDAKGKARSFAELLPEISDAFQKISKEESFGIGSKLGLDEGTIGLLQRGRREVDAMIARQKELGVVTKQDAEIAAAFNDAWDDTAHAFRSLFIAGNSGVLPVITKILGGLERIAIYLRKNPGYVKALGVALGVVFAVFAPVAALITAVGAALFLLAEDFIAFQEGHDSLIGDMLAKYPRLGQVLRILGKLGVYVFDSIVEAIKSVMILIDAFFEGVEHITSSLKKLAAVVRSLFGGDDKKIKLTQSISQEGALASAGDIKSAKQTALDSLNFAATSPIGSTPLSAITNSSKALTRATTVNVGEIKIETQATDSDGVAKEIRQALTQEFRRTFGTYDDGVVA